MALCDILNLKVPHTFREGNRCLDDRLANLGVEFKIEIVWLDALLSCVSF